MQNENWKQQAVTLFFVEKRNVIEISKSLNVSRKSVGEYLGRLPDYVEEKTRRIKENEIKRKQYQRDWDKKNRGNRYGIINGESLRREHELAVMVLSREKYFEG